MKKIFFKRILLLSFLFVSITIHSQENRILNIQFGSNLFFNFPSFNQEVPIGLVYDDTKPVKLLFTLPPNTFLVSNGVILTSGSSLVDFKKCNLQLQLIGNGPPVNYNFTFKSQDFYLRNFVINRTDFSQIVDDSLIYVTFDNIRNLTPLGEELSWCDIKSGDLYANNVLQINNVTKNDFSKNNFSNPFTFILKKRCDILQKKYRVFISNLNCNTGFGDFGISKSNITDTDIPATIYHFDNRIKSYDTILIDAPYGVDLKNLTMYFSQDTTAVVKVGNVVQKSRISVNDFSAPVIYTFTSQAGTIITRVVIVKVKDKPSSEKDLTSYSLSIPIYNETFNGTLNGSVYTVNLPYSTKLNSLVANFKSSLVSKVFVGSILQKSGITANDFTSQVNYKVQAQDGSEQMYQIQIVKNAPLSDKLINSFNISVNQTNYNGVINGNSISVTVPLGTDLNNLIANFQVSKYCTVKIGSALQVSGTTVNNFTNSVTYIVTAEDGTTQNYVVTITESPVPKSSEKAITAFSFNGLNPVVNATISGTNITATVPNGTNRSNLIATFTASAKATVKVGQTPQVSGITPNDFTNAVTYIVTAEDGTNQNYVVTISEAPAPKSSEKAIKAFIFNGLNPVVTASIVGTTITATVPNGTNRSNLIATFTASAKATVKVGQTPQVSGTTPNDFTNAVTYTVTAEDGTTQNYTVTITEAPAPKSSEKQITAFSFNGLNPVVNATISGTNITATVTNGTNRTNLVATFTTSAKSTVKVGQTPQVSGTTPNDFTNAVTYTVTAEDGTTLNYTVTITEAPAPKSSEKAITAFSFNGLNPVVNATISGTNFTATVPNGTNRSNLIATFTASAKATVKVGQTPQVSGITPNDFTYAVTYIVTAEDGTNQNYVVTITEAPAPKSSEKAITAFSFEGLNPVVTGTINGTTITATVPNGTNRSNLIATFTASAKATVKVGQTPQVSGTTPNDFTNAVTYTVTAEDGTIQNYTVTISETPVTKSSEKAITAFSFNGLNPVVNASISGTTITATVPNGTNRTNLVAIFTASAKATVKVGQTPQVSGTTLNDFTNAVTYTVTAEDGTSQNYTVTVSEAPAPKSSEKAITAFSFEGLNPVVTGTINGTTITATVPNGTNRSNLIATFTASAKATVKVGQTTQVSGTTPNDFTNSVTYTVTAEDGTTQNYTVIISEAPATKSSEKAITAFSFNGLNPVVNATISGTNFTATVPNGTNRSNLVATFTVSAKATVKVGQTTQVSGTTPNDFTNAVTYTVTAEDGTTQNYTVIISEAPATKSSEKAITAFSFEGLNPVVTGTINGTTITATVPNGSNRSNLVATFTASAKAILKVGQTTQVSGTTPNDFTNAVTYTVTAEDGTTKDYTVIVIDTTKNEGFLSFQVNGINGVVVNNDSIITITVPDNTDITKLVATFKVQSIAVVSVGDSVQISGQSVNDYTYGVTFVITLPNGEIKKVKVIIIKEQQSGLLDLQNACFVYPNPTKGIIFIKGESGSLSIIVKDLQGRKIYENQNSNYFGEKISIDLENIPSQILFVHIINNNIEINRKIEVIK